MAKFRFHVIGFPHTETTERFSSCAYTAKARRFCSMMHQRGHKIFLYAGARNTAQCTEHINCTDSAITVAIRKQFKTPAEFPFVENEYWKHFNHAVIRELLPRLQPHDYILILGGRLQSDIARAFQNSMVVEYGIGHSGHFSAYRVFESYAWMHAQYGAQQAHKHNNLSASWTDAVIPGFYDPKEFFPMEDERKPSLLFVGRCTPRKGLEIAIRVAKETDRILRVIGEGSFQPDGPTYLGRQSPRQIRRHMNQATALLMPTLYIEPFGNVAVEAMACGLPVICTDWGAFTETVQDGVTGFRCHTLREFICAVGHAHTLNRNRIATYALQRFSTDAVAPEFERYFARLSQYWDAEGWYKL